MIEISSQLTSERDVEVLPPGTSVGEFVLEALLGSGGFARVYRAHHPVLGTRVAIKVITHALGHTPDASQRFVREAQSASRISHPNVVRVLGYGKLDDGRAYQVMELVDGPALAEYLIDHPKLGEREAMRFLDAIAAALDAAHAAGIVHRDLKPANVLLAPGPLGPMPRLADFGIAKAIEDDQTVGHLTQTGTTLGTPSYMSPEQALGRGVGPASDIYSFGVLAFELLTGRLPFEADSPLETMMMHVQTTAPLVSAFAPELGTRFDRALDQMLAKHPEDRPSSIASAMAALRTGPAVEPPRKRPSQRVARVSGALAILAILATVGALLWTRGDGAPAIATPKPRQPTLPVAGSPAPTVPPDTRATSSTSSTSSTTPTTPTAPTAISTTTAPVAPVRRQRTIKPPTNSPPPDARAPHDTIEDPYNK